MIRRPTGWRHGRIIRALAVVRDWPIFGRDGDGVAWRPTDELLHESQQPRFLRSTGERTLESLQARAVADPAWFWGAAADDLGIAWGRRPRTILDASRGPAWSRWWIGGGLNYARAAVEPRVARDPGGEALVWEGEDGEVRRNITVVPSVPKTRSGKVMHRAIRPIAIAHNGDIA